MCLCAGRTLEPRSLLLSPYTTVFCSQSGTLRLRPLAVHTSPSSPSASHAIGAGPLAGGIWPPFARLPDSGSAECKAGKEACPFIGTAGTSWLGQEEATFAGLHSAALGTGGIAASSSAGASPSGSWCAENGVAACSIAAVASGLLPTTAYAGGSSPLPAQAIAAGRGESALQETASLERGRGGTITLAASARGAADVLACGSSIPAEALNEPAPNEAGGMVMLLAGLWLQGVATLLCTAGAAALVKPAAGPVCVAAASQLMLGLLGSCLGSTPGIWTSLLGSAAAVAVAWPLSVGLVGVASSAWLYAEPFSAAASFNLTSVSALIAEGTAATAANSKKEDDSVHVARRNVEDAWAAARAGFMAAALSSIETGGFGDTGAAANAAAAACIGSAA